MNVGFRFIKQLLERLFVSLFATRIEFICHVSGLVIGIRFSCCLSQLSVHACKIMRKQQAFFCIANEVTLRLQWRCLLLQCCSSLLLQLENCKASWHGRRSFPWFISKRIKNFHVKILCFFAQSWIWLSAFACILFIFVCVHVFTHAAVSSAMPY